MQHANTHTRTLVCESGAIFISLGNPNSGYGGAKKVVCNSFTKLLFYIIQKCISIRVQFIGFIYDKQACIMTRNE